MKNNETAEKKPKNFKKFKYGSMSMIVIVLVIAIVVILNVIVGALMNRYPIKVDLTADGRYELSDETIEVLKNMEGEVEIAVMLPEQTLLAYNYYNMIPKILENYQVYAEAGKGSIEVKYVDTTKDPDVVARYSEYYNGTISDGNIVIYANEKVKVTSVDAMFTQDTSNYYTTGETDIFFVGEKTLTSSIMSVTDANPIDVAFASYINSAYVYGEDSSAYYSGEYFKNLLATNGYECTDIDVMTDEISPEKYELLVIPAPAVDFGEDVIAKIEDFLYNDGNYERNLIFISGGNSVNIPNIYELLNKWNLQVENAFVMDDKAAMNTTLGSLGGTALAPIVTIADTEAVGELPNASLPIVAPLSREITILDKNSDYTTSSVIESSSSSYLRNIDGSENDSKQGARTIVALSKRERAEGYDVYTSSVLAIGSVYMSDPSILSSTSAYNNANVLLNTVNTMTGKESSFVIPQKNLEQEILALTTDQVKGIRAVVVYVIPLLVVVAGVIVFIRRRNR